MWGVPEQSEGEDCKQFVLDFIKEEIEIETVIEVERAHHSPMGKLSKVQAASRRTPRPIHVKWSGVKLCPCIDMKLCKLVSMISCTVVYISTFLDACIPEFVLGCLDTEMFGFNVRLTREAGKCGDGCVYLVHD